MAVIPGLTRNPATLKATSLDTGWSLPRTRYGAGMTDNVAFIM